MDDFPAARHGQLCGNLCYERKLEPFEEQSGINLQRFTIVFLKAISTYYPSFSAY
jgi:hypothetical protein